MKKILVTGGAGFIGSNLIKILLHDGYEVYSLDNYSTGSKDNHVKGAYYIDDDINNINLINQLKFKIDFCFHLAANARVQPSFEESSKYFYSNVSGTLQIMEWARKTNVKVIYAGSSSKHHDPSDSPYAMYKFLGEEVCKLYKKSFNVNVEIARFYNVYGPNENLDEVNGNVIGIWRSKIKKGEPLPIVGDGNQRRDFTHVHDIVDGLIRIALANISNKDAWELGTGVNYSINELFSFFNEKFNVDSIHIPDQKGNYRSTLRINDEMLKKLNWVPKDKLRDHILSL